MEIERFIVWKDLWYAATLTLNGDHWCDFKVYPIEAFTLEGVPLYERHDWSKSGDHSEMLTDAAIVCEGFIKWDGCSEFGWAHEHFCGLKDATDPWRVIERIYRETEDFMPRADRELMGTDDG